MRRIDVSAAVVVGACQDRGVARIRKAPWPPYLPADVSFADLGIERLAWLAAEPEIERRTRETRFGFVRVLGDGLGSDMMRERREHLRAMYSPAVSAAASRLTAEEASTMRRTGTLPAWFFDAVEQHRASGS